MASLRSAVALAGILLLCQRAAADREAPKYHLGVGFLTWPEAQSFCRLKYTDLATVRSMDDMEALVQTLSGHVGQSWIGLHRGGFRRWMWSDGRGGAGFTKWGDGEPNDAGGEGCVELSESGSWNDLNCAEEKDFVCYEGQDGNINYKHYKEKRSWADGLQLCRSSHTDLAFINNDEENSKIAELVRSWTGVIWLPNKVWIGLFSDAWTWSDGSQTSFRYWTGGEPTGGNCASVRSVHGRWLAAPCYHQAAFVCQGDLKVKKTVIRVKVSSDADLADATVEAALLEKLTAALVLHSATDFTLGWRQDTNEVVFQSQEQAEVVGRTEC